MRPSRESTDDGNSVVPLRVDRVADNPGEPARRLYCTDIEGTELRLTIRASSAADLPLETGEWYRFGGVVRAGSLEAELLFPPGDGSLERIDPPERRTPPSLSDADEPWLIQLGASEEIIAVTVQPRPTDVPRSVRAGDPETFEIGAVCFAHCDGSGDRTVYHREEPDTRDEHLLLQHVVADLSEAEGTTLVAHGSDHSPLEMLYTRLALAAEGELVDTGAERVLEECHHADPESVTVRAGADTLTGAARHLGIEVSSVLLDDYDIGVDSAEWREDREIDTPPASDVSDPRMTDQDYATLVERYLGTGDGSAESTQLGQCLNSYASADLALLCGLVTHGTLDRLGCPQLAGRLPRRDQSA
jgi:hypothetical protein